MRQHSTSAIVLLAALLLAAGAPARAQGVQTGTLQGTVRDATGLVVPGAAVTVTSPAVQGPRRATSDANGVFVIHGLLPGRYLVTITRAGFTAVVDRETAIDLGRTTAIELQVQAAGVVQEVVVAAEVPSALATVGGGMNFTADEVDRLPGARTLPQIAQLAPGLTGERTTPEAGQIQVGGAPAYDHQFLMDGVDGNDNLFGVPNSLYIEDAIQETQVLTSGLPAEYGRFAGGVVNAITRSGGNRAAGTFRVQFGNDAWTARTPFEIAEDADRVSALDTTYEATAGGPLRQNRLWIFAAGRMSESTSTDPLPQTALPVRRVTSNRRGEVKITAAVADAHTIQGSVFTNPSTQSAPAFPFSIDPLTAVEARAPNHRVAAAWRGVLGQRAFATVQFSEKRFGFRDAGGSSLDIVDSPFITLTQDLAHYNAPYFDATDPEDRDNRQIAGSVSYPVASRGAGSHDFKAGAEIYRSRLVGGNSQSPTGVVFLADYAEDESGRPALDAQGRLVPRFVPDETAVEYWVATRGARLDIRTTSLYVQDHWTMRRWTIDAGLRYERVRSAATGDIRTVRTGTWMPRLGVAFAPAGDDRLVLQGTYSHYSGRYTEPPFSRNTTVGNPVYLVGVYTGPEGEGRAFADGFDLTNYEVVYGEFPSANVFIDDGISTPVTREWTAAAGVTFARGYAKGTYVWRDTSNFIEDFITLDGGSTTVSQDGISSTFQNVVLRNTDDLERRYQGLILESRYRIGPGVSVTGHWTIQVRNHGTVEGEAPTEPAIPSAFGDYPEGLSPARHYPFGRLPGFQRHRVRVWAIAGGDHGRIGRPFVSVLYRYDAPTTYSLAATGVPLSAEQEAALADYASLPIAQTLYFGERGAGQFSGSHIVDAAFNYQLPVWRTAGPWLRVELLNVFNSTPLIRYNTAVEPDYDGPVDELGLPTEYVAGSRFGQAESNAHFPLPRTLRLAFGFRF